MLDAYPAELIASPFDDAMLGNGDIFSLRSSALTHLEMPDMQKDRARHVLEWPFEPMLCRF
jgi:hypothetical protein